MSEPLPLYETKIIEDWIDYNGHLYDGYYAVLFARAVDEFLIKVGLDGPTREATRRTVYTMETHVRFLREVKLGERVAIAALVLEIDTKRARLFLEMHRDGILSATSEQLLMSIDQSGEVPKVAPWLEPTAAVLTQLRRQHATIAVPDAAGRGIAIRR
jgi:acyl-CoA thioester hydrolase